MPKSVRRTLKRRLMKLNITRARARNAHLRPAEVESAVDQALSEVRAGRSGRSTLKVRRLAK